LCLNFLHSLAAKEGINNGSEACSLIIMPQIQKVVQNTLGWSTKLHSFFLYCCFNPNQYLINCCFLVCRVRASLAVKLEGATRVCPGVDGEIIRDVIRTFQRMRFFQRNQPGQRMLLNILFVLVTVRPDIGYCQGMNYVVGALMLGRLPAELGCESEAAAVQARASGATGTVGEEEDGLGQGRVSPLLCGAVSVNELGMPGKFLSPIPATCLS
jgi:hypothetical protein